ncbi:hypothetical protein SAMN05444507_105274 [Pseudomonas syringae]|nr:hypothetical protein SAMN05444507_105274 [Pseudomonas syringae]
MNATAPLCALLQRSLSGDQWFGWMCEFVLTRLNAIARRDDDEKDVDSARKAWEIFAASRRSNPLQEDYLTVSLFLNGFQ